MPQGLTVAFVQIGFVSYFWIVGQGGVGVNWVRFAFFGCWGRRLGSPMNRDCPSGSVASLDWVRFAFFGGGVGGNWVRFVFFGHGEANGMVAVRQIGFVSHFLVVGPSAGSGRLKSRWQIGFPDVHRD